MLAVRAISAAPESPLDALQVGDVPDSEIEDAAPAGWVPVTLKAMALNQHDVWSLRGVGLAEEHLPMVLGCDGAGVTDDGREVIVHAVIISPDWTGPETQDPKRALLSERQNGTLAERVWVPAGNLVAKPAALSFEEAACLPTAWLTAYSMLGKAELAEGDTLLVQGASGGVSTALVCLGSALGYRVWVTSRDAQKGERALQLGADQVFESGARLPQRVDAVMESVGAATWAHSLRALRPGGTIVTCGATSGDSPSAEPNRVFFQQLRILGSTMGSRQELEAVTALVAGRGIHPVIDSVRRLAEARGAFERLLSGESFGKLVLTT